MAGYNPWKKKSVCLYRLHRLGEDIDLIGDNLQVRRFYIPGHQGLDLFPGELNIIVLGCLHEQEGKVVPGVQPLLLRSLYEAVEQTGSVSPIVTAMVDPVFPALDVDANALFAVKYEISYLTAYAQSWKMRKNRSSTQMRA